MRTARVVSTGDDTLPDLDPSDPAASVLRVLTDCADKDHDLLYIDPIEPAPKTDDPISYDIPDGLFHHAVLWNGRKLRQRGYSGPSGKSEGGALY